MTLLLDYSDYRPEMLKELIEVLFAFDGCPPAEHRPKGQNRSMYLDALLLSLKSHAFRQFEEPPETYNAEEFPSNLTSPQSLRGGGGSLIASPCLGGGGGGGVVDRQRTKRSRDYSSSTVHLAQLTPTQLTIPSRDRWADDDTAELSEHSGYLLNQDHSEPLLSSANPFSPSSSEVEEEQASMNDENHI
jgi:hypothetical protein